MIHLVSPSGKKEIMISKDDFSEVIHIEDFEEKDNDFHLQVFVQGNHSSVSVVGRAFGKKKSKKKWKIELFLEGNSQSAHLDIKGIADDFSQIEFDGGGIITQYSHQCSISIEEKIFLFSSHSQAKAIPVLRVETEDVLSASHSASISPFSEETFFFLESRGISKEEGKELLKAGVLEFS